MPDLRDGQYADDGDDGQQATERQEKFLPDAEHGSPPRVLTNKARVMPLSVEKPYPRRWVLRSRMHNGIAPFHLLGGGQPSHPGQAPQVADFNSGLQLPLHYARSTHP
jgi:hypothetical protein